MNLTNWEMQIFVSVSQGEEFRQFWNNFWLKRPLTRVTAQGQTSMQTRLQGGRCALVQLLTVSSCTWWVICLTDGSCGWLSRGIPQPKGIKRAVCACKIVCGDVMILYTTLSKILYQIFSKWGTVLLVSYTPVQGMGMPPPPSFTSVGDSCVCFVLIPFF